MNCYFTCNCSTVVDTFAVFVEAGVGLRLRFLAFCTVCGDNEFMLAVIDDGDPVLPFSVLRDDGGDLYLHNDKFILMQSYYGSSQYTFQ